MKLNLLFKITQNKNNYYYKIKTYQFIEIIVIITLKFK